MDIGKPWSWLLFSPIFHPINLSNSPGNPKKKRPMWVKLNQENASNHLKTSLIVIFGFHFDRPRLDEVS